MFKYVNSVKHHVERAGCVTIESPVLPGTSKLVAIGTEIANVTRDACGDSVCDV